MFNKEVLKLRRIPEGNISDVFMVGLTTTERNHIANSSSRDARRIMADLNENDV